MISYVLPVMWMTLHMHTSVAGTGDAKITYYDSWSVALVYRILKRLTRGQHWTWSEV